MRSLSSTRHVSERSSSVNPIDTGLAPSAYVVRCSVSCAMTRPAGQCRHRPIARVAHKSCASLERREGSAVCLIYTYSSAEPANCPIPKKVRRLANPYSGRKLVLGILASSATRRAKVNDATSEPGASHRWMQFKGKVPFGQARPAQGPC
jgi:hypothetical protein